MIDMNTAVTIAALTFAFGTLYDVGFDVYDRFKMWRRERKWKQYEKELMSQPVLDTPAETTTNG